MSELNKLTIFIAGDSTAAEKLDEKRPEAGWGEFFEQLFTENVKVRNLACNGRSTKSFIAEGRLDIIKHEIGEGDYLFIQFGHNDGKSEDPERFTEPYGEYQQNLLQYINCARAAGATPVLLTSVTRMKFADGALPKDTIGEYPQAMTQLAQRENVVLLDLYTATWRLVSQLGEEGTKKLRLNLLPSENKNYPEGVDDYTHYSYDGAKTVAQLVADEIGKSSLPLGKLLI